MRGLRRALRHALTRRGSGHGARNRPGPGGGFVQVVGELHARGRARGAARRALRLLRLPREGRAEGRLLRSRPTPRAARGSSGARVGRHTAEPAAEAVKLAARLAKVPKLQTQPARRRARRLGRRAPRRRRGTRLRRLRGRGDAAPVEPEPERGGVRVGGGSNVLCLRLRLGRDAGARAPRGLRRRRRRKVGRGDARAAARLRAHRLGQGARGADVGRWDAASSLRRRLRVRKRGKRGTGQGRRAPGEAGEARRRIVISSRSGREAFSRASIARRAPGSRTPGQPSVFRRENGGSRSGHERGRGRTWRAGAVSLGPPRTMSAAVVVPPHLGAAAGAAAGCVGGGVAGPAAAGPHDLAGAPGAAGAAAGAGAAFAFCAGFGPSLRGAGSPGPLPPLFAPGYREEGGEGQAVGSGASRRVARVVKLRRGEKVSGCARDVTYQACRRACRSACRRVPCVHFVAGRGRKRVARGPASFEGGTRGGNRSARVERSNGTSRVPDRKEVAVSPFRANARGVSRASRRRRNRTHLL